ncbi:MAG: PilN domain-containing protein [Gammaproteobacteria bacterium]
MRLPMWWLRIWPEITALIAWWLRELHEIVESLAERLLPGWAKPVLVRLESGAIVEVGKDSPLEADDDRAGARAILLLSSSQVLNHEISLPLATERELDAAIDLHLERELPLPRAQVCIHWRVVSRDRAKRRLLVGVHVAHRSQIEKLGEMLTARGLRLSRVAVATGPDDFEGDLLPQRSHARPFRITRLDRRLALIGFALGIVTCSVVACQWIFERTRVNAELARVGTQAQRARNLAHDLGHGAAGPEALIALMARPDAVDVLRTLTSEIPSDTWMYELEIRASSTPGYQVKLGGYAPAATMFVDALEKRPKFDGVRLVSAASAGIGTARDRLTVTAGFVP